MLGGTVAARAVWHQAMPTSRSEPGLAGWKQRQGRQHPQPASGCRPRPTSAVWEAAAGTGRENLPFPASPAMLASPRLSCGSPQAVWRAGGYLSGCGFPSALPEQSPTIPGTAGGTGLGFPAAAGQGTCKQRSVQHWPLLQRPPSPGHCTHMETGQRGSCKGNPPGVHGTVAIVRGRGQIGDEGVIRTSRSVCCWC